MNENAQRATTIETSWHIETKEKQQHANIPVQSAGPSQCRVKRLRSVRARNHHDLKASSGSNVPETMQKNVSQPTVRGGIFGRDRKQLVCLLADCSKIPGTTGERGEASTAEVSCACAGWDPYQTTEPTDDANCR